MASSPWSAAIKRPCIASGGMLALGLHKSGPKVEVSTAELLLIVAWSAASLGSPPRRGAEGQSTSCRLPSARLLVRRRPPPHWCMLGCRGRYLLVGGGPGPSLLRWANRPCLGDFSSELMYGLESENCFGLLQYFNLVEGCITMVQEYQTRNNFTYDWIVRTRVDGYWNAPLGPEFFISGQYIVPAGSTYGGLNDRLGIGDLNSSTVALSRLSLISKLESAGLTQLNSEAAFKAQLTTQGVPFLAKRLPFCIVTDRKYDFPPYRFGVPVAALSSPGPLSGAKCRPCISVCEGSCVAAVMSRLDVGWSWTDWENNTLKLCDARDDWERGWEKIFDKVAGKMLSSARKRVMELNFKRCVDDFNDFRRRSSLWETPRVEDMCRLGLGHG